ncbi:4-hydroxythreonine-4-phosphate dehydrogenase PdxA, partial [Rubrivirga sp.]|uniref:4-hydroxythreonine-4-phosphate dehydrogenase PdxA n=1 Tax=Rubrivirga sp. TaxID=1885344 RepID=UPI003C71770E
MRPRLAVSIGDPNGIGPEVVLKAARLVPRTDRVGSAGLSALEAGPDALEVDLVAVGSASVLRDQARRLGHPVPHVIESVEQHTGRLSVLDIGGDGYEWGSITSDGGDQAMRAVARATDLALEGAVDGIVTAPISKEAIQRAGWLVPGHTEFLQERTGAETVVMVLAADLEDGPLRVALVTIHVPVSAVARLVTGQRIERVCTTLSDALRNDLGIESPRLAVLGLNPHAGDGGVIGSEEIEVVGPALERLRADDLEVAGPFPADAFFGRGAWRDHDAVVAMYHDQGLAPFKALAQGAGVNVTLGLPIVRTSPDHGTALDVAGRGVAD